MKRDYDTAIIGNGMTVRTRRRPEYTRRTLGANAPTFRVSLAVVNSLAPSKPIDPSVCSVPSGCTGKVAGTLASGQFRCADHLAAAVRLGYGVIWCPWCLSQPNQDANRSDGICRHHSEQVQAEYRERLAARKLREQV